MDTRLPLDILPQPTLTTCGPTCLHAVYGYYGDKLPLSEVIASVNALEEGGTLAVELGRHALRRGYRATIRTLNLQVFDPSWFGRDGAVQVDLAEKLRAQRKAKNSRKLRGAIDAYLDYLALGGLLRMETFSAHLLRAQLSAGVPLLAGLSATWLYGSAREHGPDSEYDDVRGEPSGHFVVLAGYDREARQIRVADPYLPNPLAGQHHYDVDTGRVLAAIHLGILTYDANLLSVEPRDGDPRRR
ncbi:MAG: hypothetical protein DHS20C15_04470 [Planctomycetota bacterium]|nr:MAG: hypothetical protein DHS20C15_04470 [Planctomycetota bacterium]